MKLHVIRAKTLGLLPISLISVFAVMSFATPAFASTSVCTPDNTIMNIVAHADDSLLFQSPRLLQAIQAGECSVTVVITAGDAGQSLSYTIDRELGTEAAYANMAGVANEWTTTDSLVGGRTITTHTLNGTNVSLVFLRMPDGGVDGSGFNNAGSLEALWKGTISTMVPVDATPSYTRQSLTDMLTALMNVYQPSRIDTQDFVGTFNEGDHSDHYATAYFSQLAARAYTGSHTTYAYEGYLDALLPANVFDPALTQKMNSYFAYAAFDADVCNSVASCAGGRYGDWLNRQYVVASETGGMCALNTSTAAVVSDTGDMTSLVDHAVATYIPPTWTVSIPGATWIWNAFYVSDPTNGGSVTFTKQFTVTGTPTSASIVIGADDNYEAQLNGKSFATIPDGDNFTAGNEDTFNVSSLVHAGSNTLTITVHNSGSATTTDPTQNPAGLLYKLTINQNACTTQQYGATPQPADVSLVSGTNLTTTYDGTAKPVAFKTFPTGLSVVTTYNGSSTAPVAAGAYNVVATISDPNYTGTASATLTINKADQTISFDTLGDKHTNDADFTVSASASSSLPVTFGASGACTVSAATVHLTGAGTCTITADQAGDTNYNAAPQVVRTFTVTAVDTGSTGGGSGSSSGGSSGNSGGGGGGGGVIYGPLSFGYSNGNGSTVPPTTITNPTGGQVLGASVYHFTKSLRKGSRGVDVTELQKFLTLAGYYKGPITGYFGPLTEAAVKAYQTAHKLAAVGNVGPLTRALLNQGIY